MATRREAIGRLASLAAAAALGPSAWADGSAGTRRPNILFIMSDDHTSQAWGCYGSRLAPYAPTRHIDRLAAEGAALENCFCTNAICVPSRATIMTGQYSHMNGAKTLGGSLSPDTDNVAKRLQAAGYRTALIGKWHLKEPPAGFDHYEVLHGQGRYHDPILWSGSDDWDGPGTAHEGHSTDVITSRALRWLDRAAPEPFALMCHYKAVHEPFYGPERYRHLLKDVDLPEPADLLWPESPRDKVFDGWPLEILMERFLRNPHRYSPPPLDVAGLDEHGKRRATYQKFIHDYLRCVAGIDDNVGRLLRWLDRSGLSEDTLVIYTSDQGYFLGEHNLFDKRFMLEESLRMPFVARYRLEIPPGLRVDDLVTNVDFAETLLDFAGAEIPGDMQGRSFRPCLRGESPADWRDAVYYHYWTHQPTRPSHYGVRTRRYKLIYYYGLVREGRRPGDCWELYDLDRDPHERANVIDHPRYRARVLELKAELRRLREQYGDTADPLAAPFGA
ncbi:MAG: sulfatase-like hydrolase/transferase [Armatimonadia bacterium]|nr:sulfatase-like hydrolase/transferase [Armatimonadia bacterium]